MHPYYYHRPPSRLFWFFLGGVTAAWFIHSRSDRDRAEWRSKCLAWKTRYGLEDSQSQNQSQTYPQGGTQAQDRALEDEKYMWWKLRTEREAERKKAQDFHKQMDYAKDTVLDATEKGLESLRANLESLSKVVHEQRATREQTRAPSPEVESNKKLV